MKNVLIAFGIILMIFMFLVVIAKGIASNTENNKCIMENPQQVTSGIIIESSPVIFTQGPELYYLYYKGKTKLSGELCEEKIRVTKEEYERRMYVHD